MRINIPSKIRTFARKISNKRKNEAKFLPFDFCFCSMVALHAFHVESIHNTRCNIVQKMSFSFCLLLSSLQSQEKGKKSSRITQLPATFALDRRRPCIDIWDKNSPQMEF
jgi:hypothetical protein